MWVNWLSRPCAAGSVARCLSEDHFDAFKLGLKRLHATMSKQDQTTTGDWYQSEVESSLFFASLCSEGRSEVDAAGGAYKVIAAGARRRWERGFRRLDAVACNLALSQCQERGVDDHNTMAFLAHIAPYLTV